MCNHCQKGIAKAIINVKVYRGTNCTPVELMKAGAERHRPFFCAMGEQMGLAACPRASFAWEDLGREWKAILSFAFPPSHLGKSSKLCKQ